MKEIHGGPTIIPVGTVVEFEFERNLKDRLTVYYHGKSLPGVTSWEVMPFQPDAVMCWVYLRLVTGGDGPEYQYTLAKNVLAAIRSHPLRDEVAYLFCISARGLQSEMDSKTSELSKAAAQRYLREYPGGVHRDDVEWMLFRYQTEPYEYEGQVPSIESSIRSYRKFLSEHPRSSCRGEIMLSLAHLYRMAAESILERYIAGVSPVFSLNDTGRQATYTKTDAAGFLAQAREIYTGLLHDSDLKIRAEARLKLFNIQHGRWVYSGGPTLPPHDW